VVAASALVLAPAVLAEGYTAARTDVVEVDPEVPRLAERLFGFKPGAGLRVLARRPGRSAGRG
jgi:hypothetical protein